MDKNSKRLGTEKISKLLWMQSLPSIIAMIFMSTYNVVDAIFIGQGVGSLGIAGLAISFPLQMIIMAMAFGIGFGASSIVSRALGAKKKKKAEITLGNAFGLAILFGLVTFIFGHLFLEKILIVFGASETILPFALEYMKVILFGAPFIIFAASGNNIIRSQGSAKYSMFVMVTPAIINVFLDALFIFVFKWGMFGAGLATIIGQFISFSFVLFYFLSKMNSVKLYIKNLFLKLSVVKEILSIGVSSIARNAATSIVSLVMNNSLGFYGGDIAIASHGVFGKVIMLVMMPMFGFVQGLQPVLGFNYGAKKFKRAKDSIIDAIKKTTIYSIIGFIVIYIFTYDLVRIFTNDKELIDLSVKFIRIAFILLPIVGFQVISSGIYQTMGKARMAFLISLLRQAILVIPLALILPNFFGLIGVFMAFPIADGIASWINFFLLKYEFKLLDSHKANFKTV